MGFEEGNFWFSHFPIRAAFLFALKAEFTCHHSLKLVPLMTFLLIWPLGPSTTCCLLVCVKKLWTLEAQTETTIWEHSSFSSSWASLHLTEANQAQTGELWIKSQPFLLSLIYSAAPAGLNSHCGLFTLSLANKSQNMTCALVSITLLPLKTRFSCTLWGIAPDKHVRQFHIKTTLMPQQSCISHSALTATDAPI